MRAHAKMYLNYEHSSQVHICYHKFRPRHMRIHSNTENKTKKNNQKLSIHVVLLVNQCAIFLCATTAFHFKIKQLNILSNDINEIYFFCNAK